MPKILKIAGIAIVLAMIFLTSGWIANLALAATGCIWTSSGVFGVSFIGISVICVQACLYVMDMLQLF